jgi:2-methylisocitrate lyase-like PEP mutase family enzyme
MLAHIRTIVAASDLPVSADFRSGYADDPAGVAENVRLCVETGVAGLSIEDATGDPARPFYEPALAVERLRAARAAIDASGSRVVLTGRTECFLAAEPDLDAVGNSGLRRAGPDCLFAPGSRTREQIAAVVQAVAPKPVNVIMSAATEAGGARSRDARRAPGQRRQPLARAAWCSFIRAAREIASEGRFDALADATPFPELNQFFRDDPGAAPRIVTHCWPHRGARCTSQRWNPATSRSLASSTPSPATSAPPR